LAVAAVAIVLGAHFGVGAMLIDHWGFSAGVVVALIVAKLVAVVGVHVTTRWRCRKYRALECDEPVCGHRRRLWRPGRGGGLLRIR